MKKKILTLVACMLTLGALAQEEDTANKLANIDWNENPDEMTTIDDIKSERQSVANRVINDTHIKKIWANHGYFHIAYHLKGSMNPTGTKVDGTMKMNGIDLMPQNIYSGMLESNGSLHVVPKYTVDFAASIQAGKNIKLHKPIIDIFQFNIDFTGADLTFSRYKAYKFGDFCYDSSLEYTFTDDDGDSDNYRFCHWNSEKYEISYGMNLGPSLTIAPFARMRGAKGLHYMKFNFYWHIGYCFSAILQNSKASQDMQYDGTNKKILEDKNPTQILGGHGLYQTMGFNMAGKRIGMGYEHRWGKVKYVNFTKRSDYGGKDLNYKFDTSINRIFISYRFGK